MCFPSPCLIALTIQCLFVAIWAKGRDSITDQEHEEFYRYLSGAWDTPLARLHFVADVPVSIKALFYVPSFHMEKMGTCVDEGLWWNR